MTRAFVVASLLLTTFFGSAVAQTKSQPQRVEIKYLDEIGIKAKEVMESIILGAVAKYSPGAHVSFRDYKVVYHIKDGLLGRREFVVVDGEGERLNFIKFLDTVTEDRATMRSNEVMSVTFHPFDSSDEKQWSILVPLLTAATLAEIRRGVYLYRASGDNVCRISFGRNQNAQNAEWECQKRAVLIQKKYW